MTTLLCWMVTEKLALTLLNSDSIFDLPDSDSRGQISKQECKEQCANVKDTEDGEGSTPEQLLMHFVDPFVN